MFFNQSMNQKIDNESFYKILGVNKNASSKDIKKAYHKLAVQHHPDKGGDPDKFKELTKAFETLSDDNKRRNYDQFGEGNGDQPNQGDIFGQMFGNQGMQQNKKGNNIKCEVHLTLKEIFNGKNMNVTINRKLIDTDNISRCTNCDGKGMIVQTVRMGPMIQQIQQPCPSCGGQGQKYKINNISENIKVSIPKGTPDNHKIVIFEKGDDILNGDTGDLHVIVKQIDDEVFIRKGNDLFINKDISLIEALTGFIMKIKHFDREILLKSINVIKPNIFDMNNNKIVWKKEQCFIDLEPFAKAKINDEKTIKDVIENGQLKKENITGFIIKNDETFFYKESLEDLQKNKKKSSNYFYYKSLNNILIHCVEEEGLPDFYSPMLQGDLYITFNIIFPDKVEIDNKILIDSGFNEPIYEIIDEIKSDLEVYDLTEKNPNISYGKYKEKVENDREEQEEENMNQPGMQQQQCAQQ